MQAGGQSILDRILAAKNTIAGQAIAKVVCKATTEEVTGPKRKHVDFLLQLTHQANASIPDTADLLMERSQNTSWVVAFKSLITIHQLMAYGNERFESYMASHNYHLQAPGIVDRMGMSSSDMFIYIGRYADYLNEKREAYKIMGYDFCKIERGKDDGTLRIMPLDKLFKTLPIILKQIDAILRFDVAPNELANGIIYGCFFLLFKDLLYLYAVYNDGIINLLEKYFNMNKKQCREAIDMYKKFLDRTDQVTQYFKITERYEQLFDRYFWEPPLGVDRSEISDLIKGVEKNKAPVNLLEPLENYVASLEGKKIPTHSVVTKNQIEKDTRNFAVGFLDNFIDDSQKVFQEEAKALDKFSTKKEASSPLPSPIETTVTSNENIFDSTDFFSQQPSSNDQPQQQTVADDIFSLATPLPQTSTITYPLFQNVLNASILQPNVLCNVLEPTSLSTIKSANSTPLVIDHMITPLVTKPLQTGDLNLSLNQLIDHLDINDHTRIGKDHLWTADDVKSRQILSSIPAKTNPPGAPMPNSTTTSAPFSSMTAQSGAMWQQPSSTSSVNNPFAAPSGPLHMGFTGMNTNPTNVNTNPFASQGFHNTALANQEQIDNPFGNL
ncbi:unnamed protein product [Rotaria magnacalcarata]|uniref:ENTH domain-containing protein n=3 Tax=Rotaria magnacalcarata TaxID=392030 RepID=A0A816KZX5_9BILA|nr:unnamed protein product [Rotaria magnacalcarata]CAF3925645.1 unnamed protein product [Rotaria magnacalcarata]